MTNPVMSTGRSVVAAGMLIGVLLAPDRVTMAAGSGETAAMTESQFLALVQYFESLRPRPGDSRLVTGQEWTAVMTAVSRDHSTVNSDPKLRRLVAYWSRWFGDLWSTFLASDTVADSDTSTSVTQLAIHGAPDSVVRPGEHYRFQPQISNPSDSLVLFGIVNKPDWAEFDPATGELRGTPGADDLGVSSPIKIFVTDGWRVVPLSTFRIVVGTHYSGQLQLAWSAPGSNEDGSQLTDLAGYRIYYGPKSGRFTGMVDIDDPYQYSTVIDNLPADVYYVVATAYDREGLESRFSNVVQRLAL